MIFAVQLDQRFELIPGSSINLLLTKDCYFNYLAILASTDHQPKNSVIKIFNEADKKLANYGYAQTEVSLI